MASDVLLKMAREKRVADTMILLGVDTGSSIILNYNEHLTKH